jgi:uncharacterized protein
MAFLKWILVAAVFGWIAVVILAYFGQRALMYFPEVVRTSPRAAGLPQAEEVRLETSDGERVIAWHVPPSSKSFVILYFHGNGGALAWRAERFRMLVAHGAGLLALSYRGYGGSTGTPSEAGLRLDADALYRFAAERYPQQHLVLWGESLGTGLAVPLAAERAVGALILEAPFTSAVEVGAAVYPFLPVRRLMKDRFSSEDSIARVAAPVLVLHGARDEVIPIEMGERLYARIKSPKRFVRFAEGRHSDLDRHGAVAAALEFLSAARDRSSAGSAGLIPAAARVDSDNGADVETGPQKVW